jgi:hypothetical protein
MRHESAPTSPLDASERTVTAIVHVKDEACRN